MTPTVYNCTNRCLFCWRVQSGDKDLTWHEAELPSCDRPEKIIEGCEKAQRRILSGYKANYKVDKRKLAEAMKPKHIAISLAGEPTLYPKLGDLISSFHQRSFTTFLVSNGTRPEALSKLETEPSQLYISASAPDKKTFIKTCRPQMPDAWEKVNTTLALLPSFTCPTVMRITLVKGINLKHPELYAKLVRRADPTYVEPKAYMHVGFSQLRLTYDNTPTNQEIQRFAKTLAEESGYMKLDESEESRVVLLGEFDRRTQLRYSLN